MAQDNLRTWKFLGVAAVAVVVVLILVNVGQRSTYDVSATGNPAVGDGDLTIFLFEDYECPHCADYSTGAENDAFQHLLETWVDTDQVTLVFKHVAIVGAGSSYDAARASRCVYDIAGADAWLEWDHAVYERQVTSGGAFQASESNLEPITRQWADAHAPGFDMATYKDCLKADDDLDAITEGNIDDFQQAGIGGTPGLLVGNQVINPNLTDDVDAAIQDALDAMAAERNGTDGNGTA